MRVSVEPYHPQWKQRYKELEAELQQLLSGLDPHIEHIGSTSVEGLSAKPTIDILVGLAHVEPEETVIRLINHPYIYIRAFTTAMPERRFFIRMKEDKGYPAIIDDAAAIDDTINLHKLAHIHIVGYRGAFWERHLAFREYLRNHPDVKQQYQDLKLELSQRDWPDAFAFNEAKTAFIKEKEALALQWWLAQQQNGKL
ncbi:GrpB family protein [Flavihumibacter rivuli]|uniref:GrpB family protein n=1 Tax=Flavihumibacter rivuli TaxID=2838156 RepID=UPI001BDE6BC0|nr:GrpB family protein [Flavihumibacter rivuli]ULQ55866.1 GrpB family protein [Flavihumibacter rivuli]